MSTYDKTKKDIEEIMNIMDGINLDDIKTNGFSIRCGNKVLHLKMVSEKSLEDVENELRNEFAKKLTDKINIIKTNIGNKINEMTEFVHRIKVEYVKKEKDLNDKLNNTSMMPDISYHKHAVRGISVVKSDEMDGLVWLIRGIYWPKYVDGVKIEPKFSKKMISPIIITIWTKRDKITTVSTHEPIGLNYFDHYHQSKPDCWGSWSYDRKWKTVDDIIKIAEKAQAVLENINTLSVVSHNPRSLPRLATVNRYLIKDNKIDDIKNISNNLKRVGIRDDNLTSDNVWSI